ncbi:MAG: chemotaxis protein CheA [Candidimonas sp.]|nr:MAG: chemotaxis protein CheA [Candidimonas sp.]
MSEGIDLSQFYGTFFDESDDLLAGMERDLLALDVENPDSEALNAIFRAAHSIKGGAGTFGCFDDLTRTTHLLESVLDRVRHGALKLDKHAVDLFLEARDVLAAQVGAYRREEAPDGAATQAMCRRLEAMNAGGGAASAPEPAAAPSGAEGAAGASAKAEAMLRVDLTDLAEDDERSLLKEMALLGRVVRHERDGVDSSIWVRTSESAEDIAAVCCFIVDARQVRVNAADEAAPAPQPQLVPSTHCAPAVDAASESAPPAGAARPGMSSLAASAHPHKDATTIRVGIGKVDQIINLVGELVITQAMLAQAGEALDPARHDRLLAGIAQLERNARNLQEAVMSIRMMPMNYVFSRFPRMVRENAEKLGKRIRLVTLGEETELDRGLIEHIIDPLTHLVRNSLDHGVEPAAARMAAGKPPEGVITLSAEQVGGQIIIEVSDDGGGLDRARILAKAAEQGLAIDPQASDEDVWQLVFAPGFSTAAKVTDLSGRGVGMDVVRRNIQDLGGRVRIHSEAGRGTSTRIALPLTLAILDGMLVRVGNQTFVVPLAHVIESLQPQAGDLRSISEQAPVIHVRGEYLPLIALHDVFSIVGAQTDPTRAITVIVQAEDVRFALLVDQLLGQRQVVVKNLESNYRKVPGISAATILGDGSVALIIDVFTLSRNRRTVVEHACDEALSA